ncbi:ABC transporter permease [Clavibacter nebraskensis]|uniref:Proline/glycine betaine ABC transporter,permease component n=2 Tax=Clavibacter nebraskensis TaxID=31963 RepID=A0AAI9EJ46_9MICO|nr:ABC transporter permease [Clavibacter nebraskensis]KXU20693.1 glycine/betaine ABC transporter permease [Clavibacter nebraskensis]OAH22089.1 glycine/betaine ABC transporter permease [Clavibacter nebraskensis]QGV66676.1 ABC transporter permease [Clavibacter nebraskensis]QGV69473.1 ABC transporter permease [Clavibacter nebraskensis]QGV72263.1 ABC transporter permease [Clavibacter nebraskensis]
MNLFAEAFDLIFDASRWSGSTGTGVRLVEHLSYTFLAIFLAALVAVPAGLYIGHTGRGRTIAVSLSGGFRALPTLGVLVIFGLVFGIGLTGPMITFAILGIPPLLAGVYAGLQAVDRATVDAARAVGMTEWQILGKVEIPLALPLIISGFRAATLQVISTVTLGAYLGLGGLGPDIFTGLTTRNYPLMVSASILVTVLALVVDGVLAIVQRLVVPRGVVAAAGRPSDSVRASSRPAVSITS